MKRVLKKEFVNQIRELSRLPGRVAVNTIEAMKLSSRRKRWAFDILAYFWLMDRTKPSQGQQELPSSEAGFSLRAELLSESCSYIRFLLKSSKDRFSERDVDEVLSVMFFRLGLISDYEWSFDSEYDRQSEYEMLLDILKAALRSSFELP